MIGKSLNIKRSLRNLKEADAEASRRAATKPPSPEQVGVSRLDKIDQECGDLIRRFALVMRQGRARKDASTHVEGMFGRRRCVDGWRLTYDQYVDDDTPKGVGWNITVLPNGKYVVDGVPRREDIEPAIIDQLHKNGLDWPYDD